MNNINILVKDNIRIIVSDIRKLADDVIEAQQIKGLPALVLSSAISVFAPLAATNKNKDMYISFNSSNGIVKKIIIEGFNGTHVRAYIDKKEIITEYDEDINKLNNIPLQLATGNQGTLKIVNFINGKPFGGEVKLAKADFVTDLAYYFDQSEQIHSAILSDVKLKSSTTNLRNYSIIFQLLPEHMEKDILWIESFIKNNKMSNFNNIDEIIHMIDGKLLESKSIIYKCSCNKEKVERIFNTLSKEDKKSIIKEHGAVKISCDFCNKEYSFK